MTNKELREQNVKLAVSSLKKCMLKNGINGTTKEMVADDSGLSLVSISRYFPSRGRMAFALYDSLEEDYKKVCESVGCNGEQAIADSKHSGGELLISFCNGMKELYFENPGIFALRAEVMYYVERNIKSTKEFIAEAKKIPLLQAVITGIFKKGLEDGSISIKLPLEDELLYFRNNFFGFLSDLAFQFGYEIKDNEEKTRVFIDRVIRGLEEEYITHK